MDQAWGSSPPPSRMGVPPPLTRIRVKYIWLINYFLIPQNDKFDYFLLLKCKFIHNKLHPRHIYYIWHWNTHVATSMSCRHRYPCDRPNLNQHDQLGGATGIQDVFIFIFFDNLKINVFTLSCLPDLFRTNHRIK